MAGWTSLKAIQNLSKEWEGQPEGFPFSSLEAVIAAIGEPTSRWPNYSGTGARDTEVFIFEHLDGTRNVRHASRNGGRWYLDWPEPPYLLFDREKVRQKERVFVCDNEWAASLVQKWELGAGTTSLGGLPWITRTDWSPLADKEVVILPRRNVEGATYAVQVAQHALTAGALSVKILKIPELEEGENLVDWWGRSGCDAQADERLNHLINLISATPPCEKSSNAQSLGRQNLVQCLSDVTPVELAWVMDELIPADALTLITGEPGSGKSLVVLDLVARVTRGESRITEPNQLASMDEAQHSDRQCAGARSKAKRTRRRGRPMPISSTASSCVPGAVVLGVPAGTLERSVHRALVASQADLNQIYGINLPMNLGDAIPADDGSTTSQRNDLDRSAGLLEQELVRRKDAGTPCRLVVIDPFFTSTRLPADDSANTVFVERLAELANRFSVAVVLVSATNHHSCPRSSRRWSRYDEFLLNKVASIWTIETHEADRRLRGLFPIKTNFCEAPSPLEFLVENGRVQWRRLENSSKNSLQASRRLSWRTRVSELERAMEWLTSTLIDGPLRAKDVMDDGRQIGFSIATLRRAFWALDGNADKVKGTGQWYWELNKPDHRMSSAKLAAGRQDAQQGAQSSPNIEHI